MSRASRIDSEVDDRTLITAGTTATIVGMLGVGGSEWAEADAEREAHLAAAEEEAGELARQPEVEHAGLVAYYEAKGLTPRLAREVAAVFISLIVTSSIGARTGHTKLPRVLARALIVGLGTLAVSYLAGSVIF